MTDDEARTWQAEQMWKAAVETYDRKRAAGKDEHAALLAAVMAFARSQQLTEITLATQRLTPK